MKDSKKKVLDYLIIFLLVVGAVAFTFLGVYGYDMFVNAPEAKFSNSLLLIVSLAGIILMIILLALKLIKMIGKKK